MIASRKGEGEGLGWVEGEDAIRTWDDGSGEKGCDEKAFHSWDKRDVVLCDVGSIMRDCTLKELSNESTARRYL